MNQTQVHALGIEPVSCEDQLSNHCAPTARASTLFSKHNVFSILLHFECEQINKNECSILKLGPDKLEVVWQFPQEA